MTTNDDDEVWRILGEPSRRAIFNELAERPQAVGELATVLPISRPAVSQHLRAMKDAGLVTDEERGTRRVYRLNPVAVVAFRDQLDVFWDRALSRFEESVTTDPTQEDELP